MIRGLTYFATYHPILAASCVLVLWAVLVAPFIPT